MTTRKPTLPDLGHVAVANRVTAALADFPYEVIDSLPVKVKESIGYLTEVSEAVEIITSQQPEMLAEYRAALQAAGSLDDDQVDALLASHALARLIADVAAGNVEPVAVVTKAKAAKPAAKKAAPVRKPAPKRPEPEPVVAPEPVIEDVPETEPGPDPFDGDF